MPELTISPEHYTGKDIDLISDIICEILVEHHDVVVDAVASEAFVIYPLPTDRCLQVKGIDFVPLYADMLAVMFYFPMFH